MIQTTLNLQTAPGYQVLAAAGKTVLRPGGRAATEQLFQWANFKPGETVLELAPGSGNTAIDLAKRYGVTVMGIERNPDSVAIAQAKIRAAGLEDRVQIIQGNILHLESITQRFDYVLAEAILTMQSSTGRDKILQTVREHLKPNGKLLSHEIVAHQNLEQIHQDLARAIRVNSTPLTEPCWIETCTRAGLKVTHSKNGPTGLLNPAQLLRDEGIIATARIAWNVLTQPDIRNRVLHMRHVFNQHRQNMGYIVLCAVLEA
ncbi:cyclopropane-fatty-acyl-phospholipid synthase family protein [Leptolyngbya sp. FACHB-261]|uniref:SAM-dependent methyltransferase n=1 Tax=Leptolyngbya sp. FACHB-261 TaxID=2692806 RepID=UPI0016853CB6|nr:class I SAM-dependent methyltransferase [Leptolyngbya sp. FACHB-261]MBD2104567.1 class I SAM-dependent methyltransferase [Leptolyngbya sp. FACHB-261]